MDTYFKVSLGDALPQHCHLAMSEPMETATEEPIGLPRADSLPEAACCLSQSPGNGNGSTTTIGMITKARPRPGL